MIQERVRMLIDWEEHDFNKGDIGYFVTLDQDGDAIIRLTEIKKKRGAAGKVGEYVIADIGDFEYIGEKEVGIGLNDIL